MKKLLVAILLSESAFAGELTLDQYLDQVRQNNQQLKAAAASVEAADLKTNEADLTTAPSVFASAQHAVDKKEQPSAALYGDSTTLDTLQLGVGKQTSFGLQSKLYYTFNRYNIQGASPATLPDPTYYDAKPTLELNQSLWKNAGGSEIKATQDLLDAQAKVQKHSEEFKQRLLLTDAENAYWRLSLARESIALTEQSVQRAKKIRDWASGRANLNLADKSDFLQSDAAYRARTLELQLAQDEGNAAARVFNSLRGMDSNNVGESLVPPTSKNVDQTPAPEFKQSRPDVLAARESERLAKASQTLGIEKYQPQLDAFASVSLNGKDPAASPTIKESAGASHPTYAVGLKINAPLGGESLSKQRMSLAKDVAASELTTQKKEFDEKRDWQNLVNLLNDAKKRLQLTREIEQVQQEKYQYERNRQSVGRTTLFQVLQFEQDLATTQLNRVRAQAEVLKIIAQMKSFGG